MHLKCECVNNYAITYLTWHDTHMVDFVVRIEHLNPALKKVFCKEHRGIFSHVARQSQSCGGWWGRTWIRSCRFSRADLSGVISYFLTSASHPSERLVHYRRGNVEAKGTSVGFEIPMEHRGAVHTLTGLSRKAVVRGLSGAGPVWAGWWGMRFTSVGLKTSAKTLERCEALLHGDCISTLGYSAQSNTPTKYGERLK